MLCILKSIAAWVVLWLVGINLIGFIVRGILLSPSSFVPARDDPWNLGFEFVRHQYRRMVFSCVFASAAYLFALYYFWNVWLAVAGVLIMVARIPDLIWEIKTDWKKGVTRTKRPKGPVYIVAGVLFFFGAPLLIWYSLCVKTP